MSAPVLLVPLASQSSVSVTSSPKQRRAPLQPLSTSSSLLSVSVSSSSNSSCSSSATLSRAPPLATLVKPRKGLNLNTPSRRCLANTSSNSSSSSSNSSSPVSTPTASTASTASTVQTQQTQTETEEAVDEIKSSFSSVSSPPLSPAANHAAESLARCVSCGMLQLEESLAPQVEAPRKSNKKKTLRWKDDVGERLCSSLVFYGEHPPASVCSSIEPHEADDTSHNTSPAYLPRRVAAYFENDTLPQSSAALLQSVVRKGVQLEALCLRTPLVFLTVRVHNLGFQKDVFVRMTTNNWESYTDVPASYLPGTADPSTDRFYATLNLPSNTDCVGVQFCICFRCLGQDFWDNNGGKNYLISLTVQNPHLRFGGMARHQSFA